ncbi:class I SAM-dependent methyltransferase [Piscinibacter sakaiensis]|uniref:class I SAM-dependent methyltransferase n=1 Tax=Piscinibacter sakaiensis TaxID=1547922 RepID=UPI0018CFF8A3|nr:class I SAM-dependent methyltransferase [Piscinibacter sakaiensis]
MTRNQWHEVLAPLSFNPEPVQVVDYGCGQGLATALLIDRFGKDLIRSLRKVILVEPSQVALTRAAAIVSCYANHIDVITLEKRLEALEPSELKASTGVLSIHLFSNVLDIEGYDHFGLLAKIFQSKGRHFIMAVSHDRDFDGGSTRFRDLEEAVSRPEYQSWFSVQYSSIRQFSCNGGQSAIAWLLEVEVLNGSL